MFQRVSFLVGVLLISLVTVRAAEPASPSPLTLWYQQPAVNAAGREDWNQALPIGNGRLGAMVFGGVRTEHLQLNEDSIWNGGPRNRNNPSAREYLPRVRALLQEGKIPEAEELSMQALAGTPEGARHYEPFADLELVMNHGAEASDYRRALDLERAIASTRYTIDGVTYTREYFATAADQVIAVRITADRSGAVSFRAKLRRLGEPGGRTRYLDRVGRDGNRGTLIYGNGGIGGISFVGHLRARTRGGQLGVIGETIVVDGADSATLFIGGGTSFYSPDPERTVREQMDRAFALSDEILRARHVEEFQRYFDRVKFRLEGGDDQAGLATDERLRRVAAGEFDPGLVAQYFHFGRYLLISCSRPGTQPANLQGLWNQHWLPPWDSKYTININTEMNYWPATVCNLMELHEPLFALLERMRAPGRVTAREMYGARGFVAHHNTDIWGDTAPQDLYVPATIWPMGAAWIATHLWEQYLFQPNDDFLRRAYPVMKESAEFFFDYLVLDQGRLVTGPSVSPENTYILPDGTRGRMCLGPSMDSQILDYLLRATIKAAELQGIDAEFRAQAESIRQRLPQPEIGRHGQLMEWAEDYEEAEPGHRHISHLWALHPGDAISPLTTPDLAQAARVTLERRLEHGGGHTGWSRAWIINFWARLLDGEKSGENVQALLAKSTYPNMFDAHPPFQIDGNLGGTAGIAEMLMQSRVTWEQTGLRSEIHLLPALPDSWRGGRIQGLRARGGYEVDVEWRDGQFVSAFIHATGAGVPPRIRYGDRVVDLPQNADGIYRVGPDLGQ